MNFQYNIGFFVLGYCSWVHSTVIKKLWDHIHCEVCGLGLFSSNSAECMSNVILIANAW